MKKSILVIALIFAGLRIPLVFGADPSYRLQNPMIGHGGAAFELWKIEDDKISEFSIPITFIYPYSESTRFYATTSPAFSNFDGNETSKFGGLSDLKLGGHTLIFNNEVLLTYGLNLPTGKSTMEEDEYSAATKISMPAFQFRVPSLGQGFDFQIGANTAWTMGSFIMGYGINYLFKGSFEPYESPSISLDPGNELTFTWGLHKKDLTLLGKRMDVRGDLLITAYSKDRTDGDIAFKSGTRYLIQTLSTFKMGQRDVSLFFRERWKGKNKRFSKDVFEDEPRNTNNNQFEVLGIITQPHSEYMKLKGIADFVFHTNNANGSGKALLFGLGGGAWYRWSEQITFDGDARFYFGSIQGADENLGAIGLKIFCGAQYHFDQ